MNIGNYGHGIHYGRAYVMYAYVGVAGWALKMEIVDTRKGMP